MEIVDIWARDGYKYAYCIGSDIPPRSEKYTLKLMNQSIVLSSNDIDSLVSITGQEALVFRVSEQIELAIGYCSICNSFDP